MYWRVKLVKDRLACLVNSFLSQLNTNSQSDKASYSKSSRKCEFHLKYIISHIIDLSSSLNVYVSLSNIVECFAFQPCILLYFSISVFFYMYFIVKNALPFYIGNFRGKIKIYNILRLKSRPENFTQQ